MHWIVLCVYACVLQGERKRMEMGQRLGQEDENEDHWSRFKVRKCMGEIDSKMYRAHSDVGRVMRGVKSISTRFWGFFAMLAIYIVNSPFTPRLRPYYFRNSSQHNGSIYSSLVPSRFPCPLCKHLFSTW